MPAEAWKDGKTLYVYFVCLVQTLVFVLGIFFACKKKNKNKDFNPMTAPTGGVDRHKQGQVYNPAYNAQVIRPQQNFKQPAQGQVAHPIDPAYCTLAGAGATEGILQDDKERNVKEMQKAAAFDPAYRTLANIDDDELGPKDVDRDEMFPVDPRDPQYATLNALDANELLPHDDGKRPAVQPGSQPPSVPSTPSAPGAPGRGNDMPAHMMPQQHQAQQPRPPQQHPGHNPYAQKQPQQQPYPKQQQQHQYPPKQQPKQQNQQWGAVSQRLY